VLKKKIWANFQRIIELFTQKFVTKLSKIWVWDPGSEIRKNLFRIPDPRSRGQKGTGSRIRIRNTGLKEAILVFRIKNN
jgi:ribosomal protein L19